MPEIKGQEELWTECDDCREAAVYAQCEKHYREILAAAQDDGREAERKDGK